MERLSLEEIYSEFYVQIEKVKSIGIGITHLDSHHHIHTFEFLKPVIERSVEKYSLPIEEGLQYELNCDKVIPYEGIFYDETVSLEAFKNLENRLDKYEIVETMSHPAYIDSFIMETSSYNTKRAEELKILISKELEKFIDSIGIGLCSYKNILK